MMKIRVVLIVGLLLVGCGHAAKPVATSVAKPRVQQGRPTSDPYFGDLSIFEYPDRDKKLQIDRVMKLLKIGPGKSVVDVGAGSGWFTVRAARKVGAGGVVYAEDINPKAVEYIDARAKKESLGNIKTVLGTPDDPKLPVASVDAVLMLKVYHEIAQPIPFMQKLRLALRPGALVGVIDRNGNGSGTDHGLPQTTLEREMDEAGFRKVAKYDFTKADGQDYFVIFERKD
jgi:ubiquinone/menaquinone biosynthesis C-methylase UbiE